MTMMTMSLSSIAIFGLAIVQHSLCHDTMNEGKDPIQRFLQLDTDSRLELVKIDLPERLHKRSLPAGSRMHIRAFGEDVDLWLHPRDSILASPDTPVYYSRHAPGKPGNVSIELQYGLMMVLGQIFEDPEYMASLVIGKDEYGKTTVNGQIESKNLVVRSLPESIVNEYVRKRRSIDDQVDDLSDSKYHVVYRTNDNFEEKNSLDAINVTMLRERVARSTSEIPYILHPKILLVVDYSIYKEQGSYIYSLLEYLLAFSNGIDLKYRSLESPRFRLHISGILIGVDSKSIPYISNLMLSDDAFESAQSMQDARPFFYHIRDSISLASYDIALTLTRLKFGLERSAGIAGKGWISSTCQNSTADKSMAAVAMSRDDGAFSGVHVSAHELGHVFGLWHDTDKHNPDCKYSNGFLMSFTPWYTTNSSSFSPCSLKQFQEHVDAGNLRCMYNTPGEWDRNLPKLMPGRVTNLDKQCKSLGYGLPCNVTNTDVCVNFYCLDGNSVCEETGHAALDGTRCSIEHETLDRYCVYNRCVLV